MYKLRTTASISLATKEASSDDASYPASLLAPDHSAGAVDQAVVLGSITEDKTEMTTELIDGLVNMNSWRTD